MDLNEYQSQAAHTACYPGDPTMSVVYPALGLAGEAGEVVDKIKKLVRNRHKFDSSRAIQYRDLVRELGDVLWYIAALATELGWDLEEVARENIRKLADRKARDVVKGEGDNR